MDLGTVKKRMQNNYYWSATDCIRDINNIFYNCYTYNDPSQDVVKMGQQLGKIFLRKLALMPKDEIEKTSTRSKATKKQIGPQTSATQAILLRLHHPEFRNCCPRHSLDRVFL
jgi:bromodomain-containing protein 3